MRSSFMTAAMVAVLALVGCSSPTDPDAGMDVVTPGADVQDGGARPDVRPDVQDAATSNLYIACTGNAQCTANGNTGLICDNRYPGGLCTRTCTADRQCGANGICAGQCFPSCTLGGGECGATGVCRQVDAADDTRRACIPACHVANAPAGSPACNSGLECDPFADLGPICEMPPIMHTGAANGAACTTDDDCLGLCIAELNDMGQNTGFPGGQCLSLGRIGPAAQYGPNMPLPQSNCPNGSIALPIEANAGEGDFAVCVQACMTDGDCGRAGYFCNRDAFMGGQTTNGFCDPIDCLEARFVGMCPAGYTCTPNPMTPARGQCTRAPGTDAGVPVDVPVGG